MAARGLLAFPSEPNWLGEFFPAPVRQSPIPLAQHGKLAGTTLTGEIAYCRIVVQISAIASITLFPQFGQQSALFSTDALSHDESTNAVQNDHFLVSVCLPGFVFLVSDFLRLICSIAVSVLQVRLRSKIRLL